MFASRVIKHSVAMTTVSNQVKKSNTAISEHIARRVSEHLMHILSVEELDELLLSENVVNQENLKLYVTIARETKQGLLDYNKNNDETDNSFEKYHEINNGFYLQYFTGDSAKAQAIFYTYTQKYLELCQQDLQKTEKDFLLYQSVKEEGDYWVYNDEYNGSDIHGAIYVLSQYSDDKTSVLMRELAKTGSAVALLNLRTENDKQAQNILMDLVYKNQYGLSKLKQAFDNNESWTSELVWYQDDKQTYISNNTDIDNQISVYEAIALGNEFAIDTLPMNSTNNQSEEEITERMAIIKRILRLDLNLPIYTKRDYDDAQDTIEILPYQEHYSFKPIIVELEQQAFNKVQEALSKYPKWNRATILLSECYKLGIGTEQSLMDALTYITQTNSYEYHIDDFKAVKKSLESAIDNVKGKQRKLIRVNRMKYYLTDSPANHFYLGGNNPESNKDLCPIQKAIYYGACLYGMSLYDGQMSNVFADECETFITGTVYGLIAVDDYFTAKTLCYVYVKTLIHYIRSQEEVKRLGITLAQDDDDDDDLYYEYTYDVSKNVQDMLEHRVFKDIPENFTELEATEQDEIALSLFPHFLDCDEKELNKLCSYDGVNYATHQLEEENSSFVLRSLETHVRENINEFCLDEQGRLIDTDFTGTLTSAEKPVDDKYYEIQMVNGVPHGKLYFEHPYSAPKEKRSSSSCEYEHGKVVLWESSYYSTWSDKKSKYRREYKWLDDGATICIETQYYDNGHPKSQETKTTKFDKFGCNIEEFYGEKIGEQKEWHENGQLKSCVFYENGKETRWQYYHKNGQLKVEGSINENGEKTSIKYHENGQRI